MAAARLGTPIITLRDGCRLVYQGACSDRPGHEYHLYETADSLKVVASLEPDVPTDHLLVPLSRAQEYPSEGDVRSVREALFGEVRRRRNETRMDLGIVNTPYSIHLWGPVAVEQPNA